MLNIGQWSGAIFNGYGGILEISGTNTFTGNEVNQNRTIDENGGCGGAIRNNSGIATLSGENEFTGNTAATFGCAIYNKWDSKLTLFDKNTFTDNYDTNGTNPNDIYNNGGAIYVIEGTTTLGSGLTNGGTVTISGGTGNDDGTVSGTILSINRLVNENTGNGQNTENGRITVENGILDLTGAVEVAGIITIGNNKYTNSTETKDLTDADATLETIDAVLNINTDMDDASFLSSENVTFNKDAMLEISSNVKTENLKDISVIQVDESGTLNVTDTLTNSGILNIAGGTISAGIVTSSDEAIAKIDGGSLLMTESSSLSKLQVGTNGTTFDLNNTNPASGSSLKIKMTALTSAGTTTFTTSSAEDGQVQVETIYGDGSVNLKLDSKAANELTGGTTNEIAQDAADIINVTKDNLSNSKARGFNVYVPESDVSGEINAVTDANGKIISASEAKNTTMSSMTDIVSNNFQFFREQINDVSKRMGDLRTLPNSDGAWARVVAGHAQYKSTNTSYQTLQIGADHRIGDFYIGATASYTDGDGSVKRGSNDSKNYAFGLYGGWVGEGGQYIDIIFKRHHVLSDYDLRNLAGTKVKGSYDTDGYSVSIEAGWWLDLGNTNFYVEPQVELMIGTLDSVSFTSKNGIKFKQDSVDTTVGRLGIAGGWVSPNKTGSFYGKISVLNDWDGDAYLKASKDGTTRKYHEDMGGTWVEYALGSTWNITKHLSAYGEMETTSGNPTRTTYQVSGGIRYSF